VSPLDAGGRVLIARARLLATATGPDDLRAVTGASYADEAMIYADALGTAQVMLDGLADALLREARRG
jgi:hypothetical protein